MEQQEDQWVHPPRSDSDSSDEDEEDEKDEEEEEDGIPKRHPELVSLFENFSKYPGR